ncbi:hypothetical protein [Pseudomonas sp.]|uniref:hypothetical protein n=1 Tax=Pseudomonas sp. TaxID=306 RepID=UPI003D0D8243
MTTPMQDALLDVRKAYRLIADYQQRMFELLAFIRNRLGARDYYQQYVYPQLQGIRGLENHPHSGMRGLPFYDLSAIWLKTGDQEAPWNNQRPGDLMFGAWVRSDTGFDKHNVAFNDETAEKTESLLVLSVVICDTPLAAPCNWYDKIWCGIDYPDDGEVNETDVPGYRCYAKSIPLEQLADRNAAEAAIAEWCSQASRKLNTPIILSPVPFAG